MSPAETTAVLNQYFKEEKTTGMEGETINPRNIDRSFFYWWGRQRLKCILHSLLQEYGNISGGKTKICLQLGTIIIDAFYWYNVRTCA